MTTITITIEGSSFKLKADFAPPDKRLFDPNDPESAKRLSELQIEGLLVQEFMPKIKAMADNMMIDLERRSKIAMRKQKRVEPTETAPESPLAASDRPEGA